MSSESGSDEVATKIARLIQEKGWNQEDFARIANLNRHTVRQILQAGPTRRLRNATISQCAEAFGLTVNELRTLPLERLLLRLQGRAANDEDAVRFLYEKATLPELRAWLDRNAERAAALTADEIPELLELQSANGPMARLGVELFVGRVERRRRLVRRVRAIAGTEYLDFLEQFVGLLIDKIGELDDDPRSRGGDSILEPVSPPRPAASG